MTVSSTGLQIRFPRPAYVPAFKKCPSSTALVGPVWPGGPELGSTLPTAARGQAAGRLLPIRQRSGPQGVRVRVEPGKPPPLHLQI